ncbi:MAG: ribosomal protein [Candidatus Saccharibacteria bacterium]|jgi:ribosomal protein S20|nr:ribosomal protein [Candidatus Saccharibacteria bacterium]
MPIIKSAKKRVKVARKATVRNAKTKRTLKTALKAFHAAVTGKKKTAESHGKAQSALDTAAKKGLLHKNKVARKKKQLSATAKKAAGVTKATAPKKAAVKKPAVKKAAAPVKKAVAKKPVAKKPAVKKAAPKKATKK